MSTLFSTPLTPAQPGHAAGAPQGRPDGESPAPDSMRTDSKASSRQLRLVETPDPADAEAAAPADAGRGRGKARQRVTAEQMATRQREISVSEFFAKNRHLLGFDNPRKALLTTVKEAVDNALDACEEAGILPDIAVELVQLAESRFKVTVRDNGPGIVRKQ